jgi:hypothetical protein
VAAFSSQIHASTTVWKLKRTSERETDNKNQHNKSKAHKVLSFLSNELVRAVVVNSYSYTYIYLDRSMSFVGNSLGLSLLISNREKIVDEKKKTIPIKTTTKDNSRWGSPLPCLCASARACLVDP